MKTFIWKFANFWQVVFFFVWSVVWQTISITIRFVTFSQELGLMLARNVWAPTLNGLTGSKIEVRGLEKVDLDKPHIYVFSHQSTLDISVAFQSIPRPLRFIAKKELLYIPFLGWYMWAMGMIFVDRKRGKKAIKSLQRAGELIRNGANIIAFPEGSRSPDGYIKPFKKGVFVVAIEAGVPIVPVAIEGTVDVMPKDTFILRPRLIRVNVGEPIPTADCKYEDREELMHKVRNTVIDLHLEIGGRGGEKMYAETKATPEQEAAAAS